MSPIGTSATSARQRRGQPGRYQLTDQEVADEKLLPSPEAISPLEVQKPSNRATAPKTLNPIKGMTVASAHATAAPVARNPLPVASPDATANPLEDKEEVPPVARLHGFQGDNDDGDPFASLKVDAWNDLSIPECLKVANRRPES